jgi:TetR/AcrR family transcriptional regulator, regulator of autoinduction and epiphytic fitness
MAEESSEAGGGPTRGHVPEAAGPDPVTGRTARAVRTRGVIVDALLGLLDDGDLHPTATRIAERAGISLRLIYHHFGDLEALYRAAAARQAERMVELFDPVPVDLPFQERFEAFVDQRTAILEWLTPVRRASLLQEPFSEELAKARDALFAIAEQQVTNLFGEEVGRLPRDERDVTWSSLNAAAGWPFWDSLRTSGLSVEESRDAVRHTLLRLLHR